MVAERSNAMAEARAGDQWERFQVAMRTGFREGKSEGPIEGERAVGAAAESRRERLGWDSDIMGLGEPRVRRCKGNCRG
jgi:hypothetical protein